MDSDDEGAVSDGQDRDDRPAAVRVLQRAVATVAVVLLVWASAHLFIPPVSPGQSAPSGHFPGDCWVCHLTTGASASGGE